MKTKLFLLFIFFTFILKGSTINNPPIEYVCIDPLALNYFESLDPESENWSSSYLNPNSENYSDFLAQNYIADNSICVYNTTETCQSTNFPAGWSIFSTYIESTEPHVSDILSELISESNLIIVKRYNGGAYLPEWSYADGVGNIAQEEGYQIKLREAQTIDICGTQLVPENTSISINEGWSMISYLRDTPQNAMEALSDIADEIILVKDYLGNVYLPSMDYNGIGDLQPGQGYQIKMSSEQTLIYDAN